VYDTAQSEMNKYLIELHNSPPASDPLQFREQLMPVYPWHTGTLSARPAQCSGVTGLCRAHSSVAFWLMTTKIAWQNHWKCTYFCILMRISAS